MTTAAEGKSRSEPDGTEDCGSAHLPAEAEPCVSACDAACVSRSHERVSRYPPD